MVLASLLVLAVLALGFLLTIVVAVVVAIIMTFVAIIANANCNRQGVERYQSQTPPARCRWFNDGREWGHGGDCSGEAE